MANKWVFFSEKCAPVSVMNYDYFAFVSNSIHYFCYQLIFFFFVIIWSFRDYLNKKKLNSTSNKLWNDVFFSSVWKWFLSNGNLRIKLKSEFTILVIDLYWTFLRKKKSRPEAKDYLDMKLIFLAKIHFQKVF